MHGNNVKQNPQLETYVLLRENKNLNWFGLNRLKLCSFKITLESVKTASAKASLDGQRCETHC